VQSDYPQPQYADFRGLRLAYYHFTPPPQSPASAGAPLVWLHANGYAALSYAPLLRRLALAGHTVYALDFAAHGNSAEPNEEFEDWFYFRDQALAFLAHLRLPRVRLIGHSLGGASSLLAAAALETEAGRVPASNAHGAGRTVVESLCLLDPTVFTPFLVRLLGFLPNPMAKAAENRRRVFKSLKIVARSYRMHPAFMNWRQDVYDAYLRYALRVREDGQYELVLPPAVEARIFRTLKAGHWKHHRSVTAPALVIQAAKSQVCPNRARALLTRNHPASLGIQHDRGSHFFPMEFPDWTVERVLEFIATT
jgi:pimeloyl-ACP methyl ester carboxylesterase